MVSDVTLSAIVSSWPPGAVASMASMRFFSDVSVKMATSLPCGEATVFVVRLALMFLKKKLILLSFLVVEHELVVELLASL